MPSADKKNGVPTGRWRVDLKKGNERYRERHETFELALTDEERVKALWAAGKSALSAPKAREASTVHTISSVAEEARGSLWDGLDTEETCFAHVRIIGEIIGDKSLDEIETPDLTKVVRELTQRGKAPGTINRYLSHFRGFLVWARDNKFRTVPVANNENLKFAWKKESQGRIRWITDEEEAQLQKYLPRNVWLLVKLAIETGCRRDELLTLEPRDVRGHLLHLWETKTDSPRTVPMSQETTDMLNELLATGTMPTQRGLRSWWDRAKKKMGLENDDQFVFHVTRHTCATRLVDVGVNLLVIKEWMGHKRIETTQRYAHVKPGNLEEALIRRGSIPAIVHQISQETAEKAAPPPSPIGGGKGFEGDREAA